MGTAAYLVTHRHRHTREYLTVFAPMDDMAFSLMLRDVCLSPNYEPDAAAKARLVDRLPAVFAIVSEVVDVEAVTAH